MVGSLLTAIVRSDGDALVMHVGEKPYVVAPGGPVELSSRPLTLDAVAGMLGQLLPEDCRRALDELGAIEHELPPTPDDQGERYTVVAARGGDDIWIEIRRHRAITLAPEPEPVAAPEPMTTTTAAGQARLEGSRPETTAGSRSPVVAIPTPAPVGPAPARPTAGATTPGQRVDRVVAPDAPRGRTPGSEPPVTSRLQPPDGPASSSSTSRGPRPTTLEPVLSAADRAVPRLARGEDAKASRVEAPPARRPSPPPERREMVSEWSAATGDRAAGGATEPTAAVVLPLARNPVRSDAAARPLPPPRIAGLDRLLRLAAARGANTLYLMANARPSVRVDGEITALDGEASLSASEVESLLLDLAPERSREALRNGEGTEWMSEVPEVGRIRCQSFRDHRGPGGIFRMISTRPTSAEQLGLSREIQALCAEPEGLLLVAGPRSSGKSTLISAFVDLINRTRTDYVITIESQIKFAHESRNCLVSQREVRGNNDELAMVVRAALRENPDILVIEDLRSPEVIGLALEAMEAGHLVIGAVAAHSASTAIVRVLDQVAPDRRDQVQLMLAEGLRGVVAQVLLHKIAGGRVAARELLINTPSISNLIAEGRVGQLPLALDSGRKHGMVPLNDALAAFVQGGIVDVKEAYRKAFERQAFLAVLRREGVDTSFVERLA